jgi:hypothetical protein
MIRRLAMLFLFVALPALVLFGAPAATRRAEANPPYVGPAVGPGYDQQVDLLKQIRDEIRALRGDVQLIRGEGHLPTSGEALAVRHCAACHGVDVAEAKGDGLVLVEDGKVSVLSTKQKRDAIRAVEKGRMPVGAALNPTDKKAVVEFFGRDLKPTGQPK